MVGFFGFVSTTPVNSIVFDTFSGFQFDAFQFDNLQFGAEVGASVPLPTTAPLLLATIDGFGLIAARRRRRN